MQPALETASTSTVPPTNYTSGDIEASRSVRQQTPPSPPSVSPQPSAPPAPGGEGQFSVALASNPGEQQVPQTNPESIEIKKSLDSLWGTLRTHAVPTSGGDKPKAFRDQIKAAESRVPRDVTVKDLSSILGDLPAQATEFLEFRISKIPNSRSFTSIPQEIRAAGDANQPPGDPVALAEIIDEIGGKVTDIARRVPLGQGPITFAGEGLAAYYGVMAFKVVAKHGANEGTLKQIDTMYQAALARVYRITGGEPPQAEQPANGSGSSSSRNQPSSGGSSQPSQPSGAAPAAPAVQIDYSAIDYHGLAQQIKVGYFTKARELLEPLVKESKGPLQTDALLELMKIKVNGEGDPKKILEGMISPGNLAFSLAAMLVPHEGTGRSDAIKAFMWAGAAGSILSAKSNSRTEQLNDILNRTRATSSSNAQPTRPTETSPSPTTEQSTASPVAPPPAASAGRTSPLLPADPSSNNRKDRQEEEDERERREESLLPPELYSV
jgi:hypothetical protein